MGMVDAAQGGVHECGAHEDAPSLRREPGSISLPRPQGKPLGRQGGA